MSRAINKTYYYSKIYYKSWSGARTLCKAFGMDLMALETLEELNNFKKIYAANFDIFPQFVNIGGIVSARTNYSSWTWVTTGRPISYKLTYIQGQPDNWEGREHCLNFWKTTKDQLTFNDYPCSVFEDPFLCEYKV